MNRVRLSRRVPAIKHGPFGWRRPHDVEVVPNVIGLTAQEIAGPRRNCDGKDWHVRHAPKGEGEIGRAFKVCAFAGAQPKVGGALEERDYARRRRKGVRNPSAPRRAVLGIVPCPAGVVVLVYYAAVWNDGHDLVQSVAGKVQLVGDEVVACLDVD